MSRHVRGKALPVRAEAARCGARGVVQTAVALCEAVGPPGGTTTTEVARALACAAT